MSSVRLCIAALLCMLAGAATAAEIDDGYLAYGRGDYSQALKLWRPVAEEGNPAAQYNLALLYENGAGVPQSYDEALKWTRLAAAKGHAAAQLRLGMLYANGRGVPQDHAEAAKWFTQAAERGDPQAQFNLGAMYEAGRGAPRDPALAHFWFNLAAANFLIGWDRGDAIERRDRAASALTPQQLADAQKRAQDWKPKAQEPPVASVGQTQ